MVVGIARPLPPFSVVVDCLAPLTTATARALVAMVAPLAPGGRRCFGRYLHTLTPAEVELVHALDCDILPIIYAPDAPLTAALGNSIGVTMTGKALALGLPATVSVVVDLENEKADAAGVTGYADELAALIERYSWSPGYYAGLPQVLTGPQLYALKGAPYWRGGGGDIPNPGVGWALFQLPPLDQTLGGQRIDLSASCEDGRGRSFTVWGPTPPSERETQPELPDSPGP